MRDLSVDDECLAHMHNGTLDTNEWVEHWMQCMGWFRCSLGALQKSSSFPTKNFVGIGKNSSVLINPDVNFVGNFCRDNSVGNFRRDNRI